MPIVLKYHQGSSTIAIWKIEEEENYFNQKIEFTKFDNDEIVGITHPLKRLEWLASRTLIRFIMDRPGVIHLNKRANGKPFIENYAEHISITHTSGYAAIIHSAQHFVSIDAEFIDDRVLRIKKKFLCEDELSFVQGENELDYAIICWSVKETIFKLLEIPGLNFSKEIHIDYFKLEEEFTNVHVRHETLEKRYQVYFKRIGSIYLTWCIE